MRKRVSQSTFESIINSGSCLDKTYRSNADVILGYEYLIKEFDFVQWTETGRSATVRVVQIIFLASIQENIVSVNTLNKKYKFYKLEVVNVNL